MKPFLSTTKLLGLACLAMGLSLNVARGLEPQPSATDFLEDTQLQQTACHRCGKVKCNCNCSCCEPVCCPKRVTEKEKKHCWCVKSEFVCIPFFRLPWECCKCPTDCSCKDCCDGGAGCAAGCGRGTCGPVCGWVRCINVLEKKEYECEKCGYEWEVKCVRRSGGRCSPCAGGGCCPKCGHGQPCADVPPVPTAERLTSVEQAAKQEHLAEKVTTLLDW